MVDKEKKKLELEKTNLKLKRRVEEMRQELNQYRGEGHAGSELASAHAEFEKQIENLKGELNSYGELGRKVEDHLK